MKRATPGGDPSPDERAPHPDVPAQIVAQLQLRNGTDVIAAARDTVAERVAGLLDDDQVEDVRLLTSELVSNGVRHGRGAIEVVVTCDEHHVVVTVADHGEGTARIRPRADGTGGFGLRLVELLSDRWEQVSGEDETTVRFWMSRRAGGR